MEISTRYGILEFMPRKTKLQKKKAQDRMKSAAVAVVAGEEVPLVARKTAAPNTRPRVPAYQETAYDKDLRRTTMKDTARTFLVIVLIFALQYIVYMQADTIQALFHYTK